MHSIICGDGPMGCAVADELTSAGQAVRVLGRPNGAAHPAVVFEDAAVVHEFSTGSAVIANVQAALAGGVRRFVIGTTGWGDERDRVERLLIAHGAAAVAAPTFSPGATILLLTAARLGAELGRIGGYDPFVVEWHRAEKRDRPSGTALALAHRLGESDPGGREPEVASLRAGSSPGMHIVGFDAPGETLELRLTARDRRSYAAGALLAGNWLVAAERAPGFHPFESVIDELTAQPTTQPTTERIPT